MTEEATDELPESCEAADYCDGDPDVKVEHEQGAVTLTRYYCWIHGRQFDCEIVNPDLDRDLI